MSKTFKLCICILILLLLFSSKASITLGCLKGLELWYRQLIPTLFPFLLLTNYSMKNHLFPDRQLFPFIIISGYLCGYPMGSKLVGDAVRSGQISKNEGSYLLSFCNNPSPMFIVGVYFEYYVKNPRLYLPLFLILLFSPLLCSLMFRCVYKKNQATSSDMSLHHTTPSNQDILLDSYISIIKIGIYVMLCSAGIEILKHFVSQKNLLSILLLSSLEITNGLHLIFSSNIYFNAQLILSMGILSFGGCSGILQTYSMLDSTDISIFPYITEKLITAMVTSLLTLLYVILYCSV